MSDLWDKIETMVRRHPDLRGIVHRSDLDSPALQDAKSALSWALGRIDKGALTKAELRDYARAESVVLAPSRPFVYPNLGYAEIREGLDPRAVERTWRADLSKETA